MRSDVEARLDLLEQRIPELIDLVRKLTEELRAANQQLQGQGGGSS